jgi:DNA-binding response OmpR family regulator
MIMKTTSEYSTVSFEMTYRFSIEIISINNLLYLLICEVKMLRQEVGGLHRNQQMNNEVLKKTLVPTTDYAPDTINQKRIPEAVSYTQDMKPEIKISDLATYPDGTVRFKGSVIPMRDQLNDLCRMFMSRPNQLVLCDEIREEIIRANRRETTTFITIAKYVSELHSLLKPSFGKNVILNHKKEGWRFVP